MLPTSYGKWINFPECIFGPVRVTLKVASTYFKALLEKNKALKGQIRSLKEKSSSSDVSPTSSPSEKVSEM